MCQLGRRIRELRQTSRMSQRDLAERAGISLVSQIELAEANLTLASLLKIAMRSVSTLQPFRSMFDRASGRSAWL
ncbi:helix-turn-helix domain-containing protein [Bradyrhizobium shewense]|uniref:helix-turn-helix domain-containing protein n=1 Tax=Bradyrhizobium shewense TaxID=1761772 RepID=UPI0024BFEA6B|nr:helix-turn-helix transcriptional regulator [Bradyrhizobium shewense]